MQLPLSKTMMDPAASAPVVRVWHPSDGVPITRSPEQHTKGPSRNKHEFSMRSLQRVLSSWS